jgi:hypothetical protein
MTRASKAANSTDGVKGSSGLSVLHRLPRLYVREL